MPETFTPGLSPQNTDAYTRRQRPINARFAGVCRATGDRYAAGTPIIKGPFGWQIAPETAEDHDTTCPPGCPCHDRDDSGTDAPPHGDRDVPDYNEDFYMTADHYDY